jgi:hypothetical protein
MSKVIIQTAEGGYKHVYPVQIVICSQGGKALPEALGLADPWSIHMSLRKRPCTQAGEPITFDGALSELPENAIGPVAIADLLHDPGVQAAVAALMDAVNRMIDGSLKPRE